MMGFFNTIKGIFDSKAMGNEIVSSTTVFYDKFRRNDPTMEPHAILAEIWLARRAGLGGNQNPSEEMMIAAFSKTLIFACLPYPSCTRALGLHFVYEERLDIMQAYPEFAQEFDRLMKPMFEAQANGRLSALYEKYNPIMAKEI